LVGSNEIQNYCFFFDSSELLFIASVVGFHPLLDGLN